MTEGLWTQCLLFVAHKRQENVGKSFSCLDSSKMTGYVLLPRSFSHCPTSKISQLLLENHMRTIDHEKICPSLLTAVKKKRVEIVELLLDRSAVDDVSDSTQGYYPLQISVEKGNEKYVRLLFRRRVCVKELKSFYSTDIHQTVLDEENLRTMGVFLQHNVNITFRQAKIGTSLHFAVSRECEALLQLLFNFNVDLEAKRSDGLTALHLAARKGQEGNIETLVKWGAKVDETVSMKRQRDKTPLHFAVMEGHIPIVKTLLKFGSSVDVGDYKGQTALKLAVEKGCLKTVEIILNYRPSLKNQSNKQAFYLAVSQSRQEYKEIADALSEYGFGVTAADAKNNKLIHEAVHNNHPEIVLQLLKYGADVDCLRDDETNRKNDTLLMTAVRHCGEEMIQLLLSHGANVNAQCDRGKTPLSVAVEASKLKVVEILLGNGADVKNPDLLHSAAERGCVEIITILAQKGADINGYSQERTLLFNAAGKGYPKISDRTQEDVIQFLLNLGADVNLKCVFSKTALFAAVQNSNVPVVKLLLANGANVEDPELLFLAAKKGLVEITEILVRSGANVNVVIEGNTPLHAAAKRGFSFVVEALVKFGAVVDFENDKELTALHIAADEGYLDVMEILLKNGADPNSRTSVGRIPLWSALEQGALEVAEMLLLFGANPCFGKESAVTQLSKQYRIVYKAFFEFGFCDLRLFDFTSPLFYWRTGDLKELLGRHIIKIKAAGLSASKKRLQPNYWSDPDWCHFKAECIDEIAEIKATNVGPSDVTFYNILEQDVGQVARYLRNHRVSKILSSEDYSRRFSLYGSMIRYQYQKGCHWKDLLQRSISVCRASFVGFSSLPYDLQEKIINYLNIDDVRNLMNACRCPCRAGSC